MNRLSDIPVRMQYAAYASSSDEARDRLSPAGVAVLAEIEKFLDDYRIRGRGGVISLRWAMLFPRDVERLLDVLGAGEVTATLATLGGSTIQETAIPCVWWLSHRNSEDRLIGHWIEVAETPSLLRSDRTSISFGLQALRERAATFGGAGYPFTNEPDAEGGYAS